MGESQVVDILSAAVEAVCQYDRIGKGTKKGFIPINEVHSIVVEVREIMLPKYRLYSYVWSVNGLR